MYLLVPSAPTHNNWKGRHHQNNTKVVRNSPVQRNLCILQLALLTVVGNKVIKTVSERQLLRTSEAKVCPTLSVRI